MLSKAGFSMTWAKGDHSKWKHVALPELTIVLSGNDGRDARRYQENNVAKALNQLRGRP